MTALFDEPIFTAAPLFVIVVPLPFTSPANPPKESASAAILTSALTRQSSRTLAPIISLNITPDFLPEALNFAPSATVTATFEAFTLTALPKTADEISDFATKLMFLRAPKSSLNTGAVKLTV